jgi:magnesium chelatase family protein
MNPCRCGYLDDPAQCCSRVPRCARDYQSKISGPLYDRIDLHVDVAAVSPLDLTGPINAEPSSVVADRVRVVRDIQLDRFQAMELARPIRTNAEADGIVLETIATPDKAGQELLEKALKQMSMSARGYHRVLRVARTLADLEGRDQVGRLHIAEALSFRRSMPGTALSR